ncbi:helix-turn-helix domain-containing protein [Listeria cornellensis]|uniref:helix-turn-helix domain-containing protein n=1 Tax=Listeria cornellensis TaxID=1494961 RepID=UPI00268E1D23
MEKHKLAEVDYNEGMKYKDIALKYGVSMNTVKSWQRRHNWNRDKDALKEKRGAHKRARGCTPWKRIC